MLLLISIGLALASSLLKPLGDGLLDTSMWVAKILAPTGAEDNETTKQLVKFTQAALMEGWLSNIPFISALLAFSCVITGFFIHWWTGIIMFLAVVLLGILATKLFRRPVSHYLPFLHHKMVNRAADFKAKNDTIRFGAADSLCKDLERIMLLYQNVRHGPPTPKELKNVPYGDLDCWLSQENRKL